MPTRSEPDKVAEDKDDEDDVGVITGVVDSSRLRGAELAAERERVVKAVKERMQSVRKIIAPSLPPAERETKP